MNSNKHIYDCITWSFLDSDETTFSRIYNKNLWKSDETVSGQGSELNATKNIRQELPKLFNQLNIKTVTDIPCGDFHWIKYLDYKFDKYIGIDIAKEIVENNKKLYSNETTFFYSGDIKSYCIEKCDLIICRDCFIHMNNKDIVLSLRNLKKSNSKYLLVTNYINLLKNNDVITGQYRELDLLLPPFNLPKPVNIIYEDTKKTLSLWCFEDINV